METKASLKPCKRTAPQRATVRPRKKPQSISSGAKAEQLAALEAQAFHCIARGRAANLELGRMFLQIKVIAGHGRWESYYDERFGSSYVAFRTAQTYMNMARKEDAISKTAESALFPLAMDPQAVTRRDAAAMAEAEVGGAADHKAKKRHVRPEGPCLFQLPPIRLTDDERNASDQLVKLHWPRAEKEILALLKQLHIECGIVQQRCS